MGEGKQEQQGLHTQELDRGAGSLRYCNSAAIAARYQLASPGKEIQREIQLQTARK